MHTRTALTLAATGLLIAALLAWAAPSNLVRFHSPVVGPAEAPVTIVEFLDPACEGCRAYHPHVQQILARHPRGARLVLRYVPFHGAPAP